MENLITFTKKILSFKSITPEDDGAIDFITEFLVGFESIRMDKEDTKNILLYKKFGEGDHLCFAGHIDVVPTGDGWDSDPFTPIETDGKIYARGAQDMKSSLCAFIWAVKNTKSFQGTLSILITSDEEGDGTYGSNYALKHLEKINMLPKYAVVAEPTCEKVLGDTIKIGRRGSINGVLKINGSQGHAAYPDLSKNPINMIAKKLQDIAGKQLDNGDEFFAPSQIVITDIRAGMEVTNVTPSTLKIMLNVRNSTKTDKEKLEKYIKDVCENLPYELTLTQSAYPFMTDSKSKVIRKISKSIENILKITPKLSTSGGTSDARYMPSFNIESVEFGVVNDTIHAKNEYTYVDYIYKVEEIFADLIENFHK